MSSLRLPGTAVNGRLIMMDSDDFGAGSRCVIAGAGLVLDGSARGSPRIAGAWDRFPILQ